VAGDAGKGDGGGAGGVEGVSGRYRGVCARLGVGRRELGVANETKIIGLLILHQPNSDIKK